MRRLRHLFCFMFGWGAVVLVRVSAVEQLKKAILEDATALFLARLGLIRARQG